ncbi:MAG: type II toxin-antitoxin system RelE/ParE family toxin [Betaproteobacteria bacterium]
MPGYRPDIRTGVAVVIRHLPPELKRAVRSAIRLICQHPTVGEPLHGKLEGRLKYRVRRYRIIYRADSARRIIHIIAIGHRRSIYEELAARGPDPE